MSRQLETHLASLEIRLSPDATLSREVDGGAFAVVAAGAIAPRAVVASAPKSSILSPRTSALAREVDALPPALATPALRLAACVLFEQLLGDHSRWAAYLDHLPCDLSAVAGIWAHDRPPMAWTRGTELEREQLRVCDSHSTLSKLFAVDLAPFLAPLLPPAAAAPVAADFLRAYALVTSRAFLVDSFHQLALVPLFDLFNHSPDAPHVHLESHEWVCAVCGHWDWCEHERDSSLKPPRPLCDSPAPTIRDSDADDDDERIELVAHAPVAPGDEVFNTYGSALPNVRLALEYGFLAEANPFDTSSFAPADLPGAPSDLAAALGDLAPTIARVRLQDDEGPLTAAGGAGDLFFDADANVSVGLWCALVCRHRGPDADHERLVGTLEEAWDAALDPDARTPADNSADKAVLELVARDIVVLARGRRTGARVHRSDLSPADLLALADEEPDIATRLAMEFAAGERLRLLCVEERWSNLRRYLAGDE